MSSQASKEEVKPSVPSREGSTPPTPAKGGKSNKKPRQRKQDSTSTSTRVPSARPQSVSAGSPTAASASSPSHPHPSQPPYHTAPTFHVMSSPYGMNGAPYGQSPHYPPQSNSPANGSNTNTMPTPAQYGAYPMHPSPYSHVAPGGYTPYGQYHAPVMMYSPRPGAQPGVPGTPIDPSPTSAGPPGIKRKRKSFNEGNRGSGGSDDEISESDAGRPQSMPRTPATSIVDMKKRTKTQRACDSCRSRKIRCDVLTDADPPTCQHCKQYGFDCTFFLPITETRFKKKKVEEENAAREKADDKRSTMSPKADSGKGDFRVFGPTSPAHLLHSQASITSRIYESYDSRYQHTWEVTKDGDGVIQVAKPSIEQQQLALPKPIDIHIESDTIQQLVNAYFEEVAPLLPVVTQAEFLSTPSPPPVLLYSMCLVAAARRNVPQTVFDSIRYAVNSVIKAEDVLSTATVVNVQALLILCMVGDCHSQFVPNALSSLWIRLGTAIRMAQDLGFHRCETVKHDVELRRRLWACCLVSDRWISLSYGHPHMIDVHDCDARLPSSGSATDLYMDALVRLSIILGRVLKTIYSPSGLSFAKDEELYSLLADLEGWKDKLPSELTFVGAESHLHAGLLHLLYACVCMIFWRVFMRISYVCPAHLKFAMTVETWTTLVDLTGASIDWLNKHDDAYDVWTVTAYAATSCALVQYHTWARRKDPTAMEKLRTLRDCVQRWEKGISSDHMSARRKTAEIITLLYEATQGPCPPPIETPAMNPTGGVTRKVAVDGITYKQDPTRPGGGVFVAHGEARKQTFENMPAGVVIHSSDESSDGDATGDPQSKDNKDKDKDKNKDKDKDQDKDKDRDCNLLSPSAFAPAPSSSTMSPMQYTTDPSTGQSGNGQASLVNFTPLDSGNVNPAMMGSATSGNVHVVNALDMPQGIEQLAMADSGFLDGLPGGMFDWGQWATFFSRFPGSGPGGSEGVPAAFHHGGQDGQAQEPARPSLSTHSSPAHQGSSSESLPTGSVETGSSSGYGYAPPT